MTTKGAPPKDSPTNIAKFTIVGDPGCGKTELVLGFTRHAFGDDPSRLKSEDTLFVDGAYQKAFHFEGTWVGAAGQIAVFDTDSRPDERNRRINYADVTAIFICFSLESKVSLDSVAKTPHRDWTEPRTWIAEIRKYNETVPVVLVGTKSDLPRDPAITDAEIESTRKKLGKQVHYIAVSAKTNPRAELVQNLILAVPPPPPPPHPCVIS